MQPQRQVTLDELNALRDQALMDRAMYDSAQSVQRGWAELPVGQAVSGLPDHFGALPERDMGGIAPELNSSSNSLGGYAGLYVDKLDREAREKNALRQADPRSPMKKLGDYILNGTPEYAATERDLSDDMNPMLGMVRFAKQGYDATSDGIEDGNSTKAIGGLGMMALSALPASSRVREAMATMKGLVPTVVAGAVAPELAFGSLGEAIAGTTTENMVKSMEAKRDALMAEKQQLLSRRLPDNGARLTSAQIKSIQSQLGIESDGQWGNNTAAMVNQFNNELDAKSQAIDGQLSQYSPQAIAEFMRSQGQKDKELADANEASFWDRPTQEIAPWLSPALTVAGTLGSAALGRYIGRRNAERLNDEMGDLSTRWRNDIDAARDPSDMIAADQGARAAQHYGAQMDKLQARGTDPGLGVALGGAVATDIGAASPEIADILRGRELDEDFTWEDFAKRMAYSTMMGAGASELSGMTGRGLVNPAHRYDAETAGLAHMVDRKGGPTSYYKSEVRKLGDVTDGAENTFRTRRATLESDARTRQQAALDADFDIRRSTGIRGALGDFLLGGRRGQSSRPQPQTQRQQSDDLSSRKASGERVEQIEYQNSTKGQPQQLTARPRHSDKKRAAVEKGLENGKSVKELHKKHEVPERTIYEWRKEMSRARRMSELESKAGKPE